MSFRHPVVLLAVATLALLAVAYVANDANVTNPTDDNRLVAPPQAREDASVAGAAPNPSFAEFPRSATLRVVVEDAWSRSAVRDCRIGVNGHLADARTSAARPGEYSIEPAPGDATAVSVTCEGYKPGSVTTRDGEVAAIQLVPDLTVRLRLVDRAGRGVAGVRGTFVPLGLDEAVEFRTDAAGHAFPLLQPACPQWRIHTQAAVLVDAGLDLAASPRAAATFEVQREVLAAASLVAISGIVLGADGASLAGHRVKAMGRRGGEAECDASGAFTVHPRVPVSEQAEPGDVALMLVDARDRRLDSRVVGRPSGRVTWGEHGIVLEATPLAWRRVELRVLDDAGAPMPRYRVVWTEINTTGTMFWSSKAVERLEVDAADGTCHLDCLAGRTYELNVVPTDPAFLPTGLTALGSDERAILRRVRRPLVCDVRCIADVPAGAHVELLAATRPDGQPTDARTTCADIAGLIDDGYGATVATRFARADVARGTVQLRGDAASPCRVRLVVPGRAAIVSEPVQLPCAVEIRAENGAWRVVHR